MRIVRSIRLAVILLSVAASALRAQDLPVLERRAEPRPPTDWLIDPSPYPAKVVRTGRPDEIVLTNGLLRRTFRLAPNAATIGFDHLVTDHALIRGVKPEAIIEIDGHRFKVGGLEGQPNLAYLTPEWVDGLTADPGAFRFVGFTVGKPEARLAWKRVRHHAPGARWPPAGVHLEMNYRAPGAARRAGRLEKVAVTVHYVLYDGIPCLSKWITVKNGSERAVTLAAFTSEILAAVEYGSQVESRSIGFPTPEIHVETDYAFGGFTARQSNRLAVHWVTDPDYRTQVNYRRKTPCLLEVRPAIGPDQVIRPGETFRSFRAFLLPEDGANRERKGLALRRLYRTVAPWVTENPLMMHVRYADGTTVKKAIDQCAEVGFEMVILTFGSGFNIEDDTPDHLARMKQYADYARRKGVEIGGYSLLSSRCIRPLSDNCINPETGVPGGTTHGNCPALASGWGRRYFAKLYRFFETTGFSLLEHDGSYPGDLDAAARPPLQKGVANSRWAQWRIITDFYKFCRANGVYLNVPDYYYQSGSSKCGMGYRETNWSLPRAQQVIHTRQNIYDGTWEKTPSMGWMFVPLTQYHGGGAAATIEPLEEHLDHYERMLSSNLAMGVQACYRGPRLYDSERTRARVKQWVDWFKRYRDILESDMVHGRRADGRDLDWMLHVNPRLRTRGLLAVFNPLQRPVTKTIRVDLYYTGLVETARVRARGGAPKTHRLARDHSIALEVAVPAEGMTWYVIE